MPSPSFVSPTPLSSTVRALREDESNPPVTFSPSQAMPTPSFVPPTPLRSTTRALRVALPKCAFVPRFRAPPRRSRGAAELRASASSGSVPGGGGSAASAEGGAAALTGDGGGRETAYWRTRIFYTIFLGYASFYFSRNSFTYVAPVMRTALGFSLEQLGVIMSVFPLAYGFSKFFAGVLADKFPTRSFMAFGLGVTGVINIVFGMQTSLSAFIALWFLNGVFQGFGAPPCAKLLTAWYPKSERGTWWGFWNTSHNTGGFLIPLLAGYCARAFGWQYGMIVPGCIAIVMSLFVYNRLRDDPTAVGLPPVDADDVDPDPSGAAADTGPKLSMRESLFKHVLSNPYVWLLALSYFFVYFVRQGVSSWAHIFLLDYKGVGSAQEAAFRVSGMEIGGLLGSLVSGWASDKMMRGRRIPVIVLWLFGVIASVSALWFIPGTWRYATWLAVFCIGFFIYGPQMLVGLAGAEIVDRSAVSSTIGLLGWIAYLGAAVSGYPLTKVITALGWQAYFVSLVGFSGMAILLLLPMWRLGMRDKALPEPQLAPPEPQLTPALAGAAPVLAAPALGGLPTKCGACAGVGSVMRLECGPATPEQALSCRYIEEMCRFCQGGGYLTPFVPPA